MLIPHPKSLSLPIEVIEELEDVRHPDSNLGFYTLGNIHVHVELDVVPKKGKGKFHLACTPYIDD